MVLMADFHKTIKRILSLIMKENLEENCFPEHKKVGAFVFTIKTIFIKLNSCSLKRYGQKFRNDEHKSHSFIK